MIALVTGGSGSGKSAYAESLLLSLDARPRYYVATMQVYDEESKARVIRHRAMRSDKGFITLERPTDIGGAPVEAGSAALVECVSNLLSNEMFAPDGAGREAEDVAVLGIRRLADVCRHLVIVTNEVFSDGCGYDPETRAYMRSLGNVNRRLAEIADQVTEVVYGLPLCIR